MAQIDKLTQRMAQNQVERASLVNDQPMRLVIAGRETNTPTVVTMAALQGMIQEVIPANLAAQLKQEGDFQFPYQSADGLYNISVQRNNGTLQVSLTPFAPVVAPPAPTRPPVLTPSFVDDAPTQPTYSPLPIRPPSPPVEPKTSNSFNQFKVPLIVSAALILAAGTGLTLRSNKQRAEKATQLAQVSRDNKFTGYLRYKAEIDKLSEAGLNISRIPGDGMGEDYVIASFYRKAFDATVEDLQKRIKADPLVEGSETLGAKADLLNLFKAESAKNPAYAKAVKINQKAGNEVLGQFLTHGKKAIEFKGVQSAVASLTGIEGLASLRNCGEGEISDCVRRLLLSPNIPVVPQH